ncbi:Winged helix-like DNA-binding domain superfamily [Sesbania bispinosa]|nr:Winged helix-like DNA-binding domain superfamily [Sesbania bispinosa]
MAFTLDKCEENKVFTFESQKSVPAPFLTKKYQLVDDPRTDHIVSWGEDETIFVVWRPLNLLEIFFQTISNITTSQALLGNSIPMVFKKVVADRWEFAMSSSKKELSIFYVKSIGEEHLSIITNSTMINHHRFFSKMKIYVSLTILHHYHLLNQARLIF